MFAFCTSGAGPLLRSVSCTHGRMPMEPSADDDPEQLEVARYPTDLLRRFRLGAALSRQQEFGEAIPELKKAMLSPQVRLRAMRLLVAAFEAKRMFKIASRLRQWLSSCAGPRAHSPALPARFGPR